MNAMTHGLTSNKIVFSSEDPAEFRRLLEALLEEHKPATPTETLLVQEMAHAHWRLKRVRFRQDLQFESGELDLKLLALLHRYATGFERTFFKSLETLKKLQRERPAESGESFVSQNDPNADFFALMDAVAPIDFDLVDRIESMKSKK